MEFYGIQIGASMTDNIKDLPQGYIIHGSCKDLDYLNDTDSWFMVCGEEKEQTIEKIEIIDGKIKNPSKRVREILEELSK